MAGAELALGPGETACDTGVVGVCSRPSAQDIQAETKRIASEGITGITQDITAPSVERAHA